MFMASNTSYALPGDGIDTAGIAPIYTTPVWVKIVGLTQWILMFAGTISLIITLTIAIINRKKEDVKKKIKKGLIITIALFGMSVILQIVYTLLEKNMYY